MSRNRNFSPQKPASQPAEPARAAAPPPPPQQADLAPLYDVPAQSLFWAQCIKKLYGIPLTWTISACAVASAYGTRCARGLNNWFALRAGEGSPDNGDGYAWYGAPLASWRHFGEVCRDVEPFASILRDTEGDVEAYVSAMAAAFHDVDHAAEAAVLDVAAGARYLGKSLYEIETIQQP